MNARRTKLPLCLATIFLSTFVGRANATTYYIDFAAGQDGNNGTTAQTPFQHAPGDKNAAKSAGSTKLQPGDVLLFKGGVQYRGEIKVDAKGAEGQPITLDGNSAGTFGIGPAVIEGSDPVTDWKHFTSQEEALGNPHWKNLVYTDKIPAKSDILEINLGQADKLMFPAQWPAPDADPFWWDVPTRMHTASAVPVMNSDVMVTMNRKVVGSYSPTNAVDGKKSNPVLLLPADGAELTVTLAEPATVEKFQFNYGIDDARITHITLQADGKEILSRAITDDENAKKEVELKPAAPATFSKLVIKIDSHSPGSKNLNSIRMGEFEGLDAKGKNLFRPEKAAQSELVDAELFNQKDANAWNGAQIGVLAKPMAMYFAPVTGFEPDEHKLHFGVLNCTFYPPAMTKVVVFNAIGTLLQSGQYVVSRGIDGKSPPRLIAWPVAAEAFEKEAHISTRDGGLEISGSYITVKGFILENQGGHKASAIHAEGADHLTIQDNIIRRLRTNLAERSASVGLSQCDHCSVVGNQIYDNAKCIGLNVSKSDGVLIQGNTFRRNGDTHLDSYTNKNIKVLDNTLTENLGHHSNGLTFYLDNENVLVEGNRVSCLRPITFHSLNKIVIRNNVLDAVGQGSCISIWTNSKGSHDITIDHNTLVHAKPKANESGIFNDDNTSSEIVIRNNIIDGMTGKGFSKPPKVLDNNLFIQTGDLKEGKLGTNGAAEPDATKIFVDYTGGDYHLKPGSPAIGRGTSSEVKTDFDGKPVKNSKTPDLGAFQFQGK